MNLLIQYPHLAGQSLIHNYGDKVWHLVNTSENGNYCHAKCKDPETADIDIDGKLCQRCLGLYHYHNIKPVQVDRPYIRSVKVPRSVMRTGPINMQGAWTSRWATSAQVLKLHHLYPEKDYMSLTGLIQIEASRLINAKVDES